MLTVIAELESRIAETPNLSPADRQRLAKCLPGVVEVLCRWRPDADDSAIVVAAATLKSAILVRAEQWPDDNVHEYDNAKIANAVCSEIESPTPVGAVILRGLSLMLGDAGKQGIAQDAREILQSGDLPVIAFLLARDAAAMSVLVTVTGAVPAMVH
jgi:hypothetical protein